MKATRPAISNFAKNRQSRDGIWSRSCLNQEQKNPMAHTRKLILQAQSSFAMGGKQLRTSSVRPNYV